jgi:hypothetical protein
MKSFMDGESIPVILHLIEEVPDFMGFIDSFICKKGNSTGIITDGLLCSTSITAQMQSGCLMKVEEYVFGEKTRKGSHWGVECSSTTANAEPL